MSAKNTYWIRDVNGNVAQADGAAERDRWGALGWQPVEGEPEAFEQTWIYNAATGGRGQIPYSAIPSWGALGWEASTPPEPYDVTKDPALVDQVATKTPASAPAKSATGGNTEGK